MSRNSALITARLAALAAEWTPLALAEPGPPEAGVAARSPSGAQDGDARRRARRESLTGGDATIRGSLADSSEIFDYLEEDDEFDDFDEFDESEDELPGRAVVGNAGRVARPASGPAAPADPPVAVPAAEVRPPAPLGGPFPHRSYASLTRAAALVLVLLLVGAAILAGLRMRASPVGVSLPAVVVSGTPSVVASAPSATPVGGGSAEPAESPVLVVHVVGKVRRPGLVELPAGARVADALEAAGGLKQGAKLGATNLAELLADGERIEIGASSAELAEAAGATDGSGAGGAAHGQIVNLNSATAEQLDTLPGVGPVTAAKILAWREAHGRFSSVEELAEVPGIGPKTLADLRPRVRV